MNNLTKLQLRSPASELVASYLASVEEMRSIGEVVWPDFVPLPGESDENFVLRLQQEAKSDAAGIPTSVFWPEADGNVYGRIVLRHRLDPALEEFGGHISYEVRPSYRGQGVAKEMLRLLLRRPEARAIDGLLLTCAPDNVASNKTILANGGVLERTAFAEQPQRMTNYYRILPDGSRH